MGRGGVAGMGRLARAVAVGVGGRILVVYDCMQYPPAGMCALARVEEI